MPPSLPLPRALPLSRALVLGLSFPLVVLNLWVFSSLYRAFEGVFSVFILAGVIALILNLPVRVLQRHFRLKRSWAITVVVLAFLALMLLAALILGPFLLVRLMGLQEALPQWIEDAGDQLQGFSERAAVIGINLDTADVINNMVANVTGQLDGFVLGIPAAILGSIGNFLGIFFLNVLTIFFLIYGGELVRNCLLSWLPEERGLRVLFVLRQNFNSFIFNQVVLAVVLASALSITLVLLGAPFPFLTGISIGLMGFIPFGAIVGVLVFSLLFMLKGFWLGLRVFAVLILVDQIIENVLPPRLLGKLTGLNPIVILFSVMVGATLAGFVGIITAVPIAATVKELFLVPAAPSLGPASAASAASAD
ncbi:MAG: AI-2E family transporter [Cyanobium sp. PLM2.Bin73]|nr:MAG: AI-2E family transporter [Cyanobium sp. PLM2.Bin73]